MLGEKKILRRGIRRKTKPDLFIMGVRDKDEVKGGTIRT